MVVSLISRIGAATATINELLRAEVLLRIVLPKKSWTATFGRAPNPDGSLLVGYSGWSSNEAERPATKGGTMELKEVPFYLIEDGQPTILIFCSDTHRIYCFEQVARREWEVA
jgi:hypothetical protein